MEKPVTPTFEGCRKIFSGCSASPVLIPEKMTVEDDEIFSDTLFEQTQGRVD